MFLFPAPEEDDPEAAIGLMRQRTKKSLDPKKKRIRKENVPGQVFSLKFPQSNLLFR